jgi:diguanylate cyclase (GGDEF)-like protein/PAS domain S-box-containing protein
LVGDDNANSIESRVVCGAIRSAGRRVTDAPIKILLVEDNDDDALLLRSMLGRRGAVATRLVRAKCVSEAEKSLTQENFDVILLDLGLPDAQGIGALRRIRAAAPHVALAVLTGLDDESLAEQVLREGAQDHLIKGQLEPRAFFRALRYTIERKAMEEALFAEKERAQVTLNSIGDAVICTDNSGNVTYLNVVAEKITGWSLPEAAGRPMPEIFKILNSGLNRNASDPINLGIEPNPPHLPSDCLLIRRDGVEIPIEDCISPIHDHDGKASGAVIVLRDVSEARAMSRQMSHSAQHDFLTGLPNRMLVNDRLRQAIALALRRSSKLALLFLDLDGFKHINDSLGHLIGDQLLKSIAGRLVNCVRASDTVSRQGGDEFVVLLAEVKESSDAAITAKKILQAVAEPHCIDQHDLHVTTSIGLSVYPDDGLDAETLIKNADLAMYQAKESGRQSYQFFKPAMNVRAVERQSIEESLRRALERQELAVHYQPKVNLNTGEIIGAEALVRWNHPERGPVSPGKFIPVAEDCGLIVSIGNWVLREACRQTRAWADAGLPLATIAVNISAIEFRNEHFLDGVFAILQDTGLSPRRLELELTETVLMKRADSTESVFKKLRAAGVQLAVDDFGTGYSSLSYLRKFPIDSLKIDQSFVRQITANPDDTAIVTAVISMGRSLNLRVIAEGVETRHEMEFLQAHHCDEAQGYYFSRPLAAPEFGRLLETGVSPWSSDYQNSSDDIPSLAPVLRST